MSDIKRISIKEFWEKGLLQEVNRQFFHPRGLALEILIPDDDTAPDEEYSLGGIWDYRDDEEGMLFGRAPRASKAVYASELFNAKSEVRIERYGWVIQPVVEDE